MQITLFLAPGKMYVMLPPRIRIYRKIMPCQFTEKACPIVAAYVGRQNLSLGLHSTTKINYWQLIPKRSISQRKLKTKVSAFPSIRRKTTLNHFIGCFHWLIEQNKNNKFCTILAAVTSELKLELWNHKSIVIIYFTWDPLSGAFSLNRNMPLMVTWAPTARTRDGDKKPGEVSKTYCPGAVWTFLHVVS